MGLMSSGSRQDGMGCGCSLALAPSLSAYPADRIIVALDGMAPEQSLAFAGQVEGLLGEDGTGAVRAGRPWWWPNCASRGCGCSSVSNFDIGGDNGWGLPAGGYRAG